MVTIEAARRRNRRYLALIIIVLLAAGGWSAFWYYAAGQARIAIDGWRAREAKAGRTYTCDKQTLRGYPFRIEVDCTQATAIFRDIQPAVEVKTGHVLLVAQIYTPGLLIGEFSGPISVGAVGQPPSLIAQWKQAKMSVSGTPTSPREVALVLDRPVIDAVSRGTRQNLLTANHVEVHGRMLGGTVNDHPVVELALELDHALLPGIHTLPATPLDGSIVATLRGLKDFAPKPWAERFREIQAAGGKIEINTARVQQGETLGVGSGALSLNAQGRLDGKLTVTAAGLEHFLNAIGASEMVQQSPAMDKVAGFLDRLSPGLGNVARQQAGNISFSIKAIEGESKLEGRPAVTLPLAFNNGAVSLGPIPLGQVPALF
ncbi:MAG TPA: DUF2125 domain-containing protein [Pseudolabrys sp.]|jgi:hypothetical protein|nr:DUF2125 domain-containing protein [Pseudolabrys sp.]